MISYKPLKILMVKADTTSSELRENLKIGTNTIAKLNKDEGEYVALEVLDKIANYLSIKLKREIEANEIIEFIPDKKPDDKKD